MKSNLKGLEQNRTLIANMGNDRVNFEVFERNSLNGGSSFQEAVGLYFLREANTKLKEVKITLKNGGVRLEPGALYYQLGEIAMESKVGGLAGFGKSLFKSMVTSEPMFKPEYVGSGELYLEPTFGHYALIELENETVVVDDGVFYACEMGVEVGAERMKNFSSTVAGGEGFFQTKLSGKGIVLLELPVPQEEIIEYKLNGETLKVDGNFAILRTGGIEFTVEKSSKSLLGSATSGEGFLNVYRGTGTVWLLPTKVIYDRLKYSGIIGTNPGGTHNTKV